MHHLQHWRLVHALAEGTRPVSVAESHAAGINHLQKYFKAPIQTVEGANTKRDFITIDTLAPATTVGDISRPLILPHEIVDHCRSLWTDRRHIDFGFIGLSHWGRKATLSNWHETKMAGALRILNVSSSADFATAFDPNTDGKSPNIFVAFSKRGRSFPVKVWDEDYYKFLSHSRFSLCPDGDQIWSYRFFEAILCGSMPVVQSKWPCYEGFRFFTMDQSKEDLVLRDEDISHNFALCRERLTLSLAEIDDVMASASPQG